MILYFVKFVKKLTLPTIPHDKSSGRQDFKGFIFQTSLQLHTPSYLLDVRPYSKDKDSH